MSRYEPSNSKQLKATLISQMIPSQTSIPLKGLTIGNFYMPFIYVTLDTITLG